MAIAEWINPGSTPDHIKRQIANIHTIFNVANTFILIWFIKYIVAFVNKLIPGEDKKNLWVQSTLTIEFYRLQ